MCLPIDIRLAKPVDVIDMAEVHMRSWDAAYQNIIPAEYIREKNAGRRALYQRVITEDNTFAYVIRHKDQTIGVIKVAPAQDEDMDDSVYELHYFYLHPDFFRKGIGSQAMDFAFDISRGLNKQCMVVWVLAKNVNAIGFYKKCGFAADGKTMEHEWGGKILDVIRMKKAF